MAGGLGMRAAYGPKQATVVVGVCGVAGASCDEGPEGTASIAAAEVDHGQKMHIRAHGSFDAHVRFRLRVLMRMLHF